ncbi:MAG TPA: serine/threonine-protein kinase [Tepidisphaeraceae bacterium]|nr:serine/threonine-protein kinase [Tepidisphaeraceae bacterium]
MPTVGQRVGEFVLDDRIARGAFGEVWRAHHHVWTDQDVAVKFPTDPQYLAALQREGLAVHGLVHPNVVRPVAFDPYAAEPYLAMEYVPGTSLRPLIQGRTLSVPQAVTVLRHVLAALQYAHDRGMVHRDVKPENVLVHASAAASDYRAEGSVKLTDFGLGKRGAASANSIALSVSLAKDASPIVGTLEYMAPEVRAGQDADARADVYACGVMLFEMLTGQKPAGTDVPSDLNASAPRHLDDAFRRSYARIEKRFATAQAMADALGEIGVPVLAPPPPLPASSRPVPPRSVGHVLRGCPQCRQPVEVEDQFCIHCGTQLVAEVKRCGGCGAYPDATDEFCIFCGNALAGGKAVGGGV